MSLPTVNAGVDLTCTTGQVPVLTAFYTMTTNPITRLLWTQVSGPDCTITNASQALAPIYELSAGTYVFQFAVTDNQLQIATDTVQLTVSSSGGPIFVPKAYPYNFN